MNVYEMIITYNADEVRPISDSLEVQERENDHKRLKAFGAFVAGIAFVALFAGIICYTVCGWAGI